MATLAYLRRLLPIMAITAICPLPSAAQALDPAPMAAFTATYKVRYGILRGEMTLDLRHEDATYIYETSLRPKGVASWLRRGEVREVTRLRVSESGVHPVDYTNNDTIARPSRYAGYAFDESSGRVTGEYKGRVIDEELRSDGHNRISAQIAIIHALRLDREIAGISVFDRARWRDFVFEIIPGQTVNTPSGEFETVEVSYASTDKDKSYSLHCASALQYLPVLIEFREDGKTKSRAELTSYQIESLPTSPGR